MHPGANVRSKGAVPEIVQVADLSPTKICPKVKRLSGAERELLRQSLRALSDLSQSICQAADEGSIEAPAVLNKLKHGRAVCDSLLTGLFMTPGGTQREPAQRAPSTSTEESTGPQH